MLVHPIYGIFRGVVIYICSLEPGGPIQNLTRALKFWDWNSERLGVLKHNSLGVSKLHKPLKPLRVLLHSLRESFHIHFWYKHHQSHRRDAFLDFKYNGDFCSWGRAKANEKSSAFRAALWRTVSPIGSMRQCPHCNTPDGLMHS